MNADQALENLLPSFKTYYDIVQENACPPFSAEAIFTSHVEQYFLVHSAKLSDIDSTEHVYFSATDNLDFNQLSQMSSTAWEEGIKNVVPYYGHKNSDVTLIAICNSAEEAVKKNCRKIKHSKNYKWGLFGWSNFKLAVIDLSSQKIYTNRLGSDLKKFLNKALKKTETFN